MLLKVMTRSHLWHPVSSWRLTCTCRVGMAHLLGRSNRQNTEEPARTWSAQDRRTVVTTQGFTSEHPRGDLQGLRGKSSFRVVLVTLCLWGTKSQQWESFFKAYSWQGLQQWASLAWWISPWRVAEGAGVTSAVVQDGSFRGIIRAGIHRPVPYHVLLGSKHSSVLVLAKETLRETAQHPSVLVVSPWTCLPWKSLLTEKQLS